MSTRRKIGDRVWVVPNAGFGPGKIWATIPDTPGNRKDDKWGCILDCGDDDCVEWPDVWGVNGEALYHVCECEMLDLEEE